ncbi:hypothetical protein SCA6_017845 [Theobroma cacao]
MEGIVGPLEEPSTNQKQQKRNGKEDEVGTVQQKANISGLEGSGEISKFYLLKNPRREAPVMQDNGQKMAENEAGGQSGKATFLHQGKVTKQGSDNRGRGVVENLQQQPIIEKDKDKQIRKKAALAGNGKKSILAQKDLLTGGTENTAREAEKIKLNQTFKNFNKHAENEGKNPDGDGSTSGAWSDSMEPGENAQEAYYSQHGEDGLLSERSPHGEPMDAITHGGSEGILTLPAKHSAACTDRRAPTREEMGNKEEPSMPAVEDGNLVHAVRQSREVGYTTKHPSKKQEARVAEFEKTRNPCDDLAVGPTVGDITPRLSIRMHEDRTGEKDPELIAPADQEVTSHQEARHTGTNRVFKNVYTDPPVQNETLWQEAGHLTVESQPEGPNVAVNTLEGSGEHNPTEGNSASQTLSQNGHNRTASKLTRSSSRKGEDEVHPPTSESASVWLLKKPWKWEKMMESLMTIPSR